MWRGTLLQGAWLPTMNDLNNNKVNNNTDFSYTRAKGASSSALTGTSCATRFLLGALGVDVTQIRREKYQ